MVTTDGVDRMLTSVSADNARQQGEVSESGAVKVKRAVDEAKAQTRRGSKRIGCEGRYARTWTASQEVSTDYAGAMVSVEHA